MTHRRKLRRRRRMRGRGAGEWLKQAGLFLAKNLLLPGLGGFIL